MTDWESVLDDLAGDESADQDQLCPECWVPMAYVGPGWVCGECGCAYSDDADDDTGDDEGDDEGGQAGYGMTTHDDQDAPE